MEKLLEDLKAVGYKKVEVPTYEVMEPISSPKDFLGTDKYAPLIKSVYLGLGINICEKCNKPYIMDQNHMCDDPLVYFKTCVSS